ncbi:MAG: cytochrome c oxidase subunit 1 [Sulfuricella sp.]|nr:cytochrome c oxidase subunit 1 [Sulfuricella sp.]
MTEVALQAAYAGPPKGWARWLFTTNHKDIGTLYLVFSLTMFFVGGALILLVRAELFQPGLQIMQPELFNQLIGVHALVMIFMALMPAATGFANWMIPLMIGAPDMALPRLNNWSFWLLPPAALLLLMPFALALFGVGDGAIGTGWTFYAPLSVQEGMGVDFAIFAIHLLGISSVMGSINIIVTIFNLRAPGMTMMRLPLFAWGWLITAFMLVAVIPVLAGGVTMLLTDRHFGTHFFNAGGGGDPILFQHLFWFFGHPEVYIVLFPVWGFIPQILSTFARKPIYGYRAQVYAFWAIGGLSVVVWGHHIMTSGMSTAALLYFMYSTMSISLPLSVLFFCWIATLWRGAMSFETPMLFAVGMIVLFGIGGLTGLVLADAAADAQYHHSYFVVAHFHYTLFAGGIMGVMAGVYYWLPKMTGHYYDETLGRRHFWLTAVAFNLTFIPQFFLGLAGMPRRIPDYALQFAEFNMLSSIGAFILGAAQLLFLYVVVKCLRGGPPAPAQVWEGAQGLEWTLSSPPPYHSFPVQPVIEVDRDETAA